LQYCFHDFPFVILMFKHQNKSQLNFPDKIAIKNPGSSGVMIS